MTTPTTRRKLNTRQQKFCEHVAAGESGTDAYLQSGFKVSRTVAKANAHRLLTNADIVAKVAQLRVPQQEALTLTKEAKRKFYFEVVNDSRVKMADRLRASELDAKMAGDFAPDRVEVEQGPRILESIRDRAAQVAAALDRNARTRNRTESAPPARPTGLSRWSPPATD